jgi:hypothetical protein
MNASAALNPSLCCPMVSPSTDCSTKTLQAIRLMGARHKQGDERHAAGARGNIQAKEASGAPGAEGVEHGDTAG